MENIYIITGHSSTAWKKQTKGRFPDCLSKNIYHRPDFGKKNGPLNNLVNEIQKKKNVLFIMDEVHVAAKKGQSMDLLFKKLKFNDLEFCLKNDIKIVEFSATPDGTVYDLNQWGPNAKLIKMNTVEKYIGAYDLLVQKRVSQFKDLCCIKNGLINLKVARENINEIESKLLQYDEPMYHIIRTPPAGLQDDVMDTFKGIFPVQRYEYIQYNGETKQQEEFSGINDILNKKPEKHTFIFIKEMLRMAVTLHKEYLGILYERYTKNPNDSVVIQGLIGRATGYNDNGKTHIFTNIESITKYKQLWDGNFSRELMIQWKSNTTKSNCDGGTESRSTFVEPSSQENKKETIENAEVKEIPKIIIKDSFDEIKKEFKEHLTSKGYGRGPNKHKENSDGFYECITQHDKSNKVRNFNDFETMRKEKNWGFRGKTQKSKNKNKYRVYPCYGDEQNKKTLKWVLVYY
tara:strand:+ start:35 stop:1414 length:1380 start_codon:yes stop_codon:yes gene_type:complete